MDVDVKGALVKIEPLNDWVLVRKDADRSVSRGGIILPDSTKIKVISGVVIGLPGGKKDFQSISLYDKVLIDPTNAIQVDQEDSSQWMVLFDDLIAIIHR